MTWTKQTKNTSSYSKQSKNTSSWNMQSKSDFNINFNSISAIGSIYTNSVLTFPYLFSGDNGIIFVYVLNATLTTPTVTYAGVNMTKITQGLVTNGGYEISVWYITNPTIGTNNVVVTSSGTSDLIAGYAISYTGSFPTNAINVSSFQNSSTINPYTHSVTTTVNNCWAAIFGFSGSISPSTAGAGTVLRVQDQSIIDLFIADSGSKQTTAGTFTLSINGTGGSTWSSIMVAFT